MDTLLCGFTQTDITPEPSTVYMDGYGHRLTPAEGVRDSLYAKVCAIRSGEDRFVIVSLDICGFNRSLCERLRSWIRGITGLEDAQFALCATHTHAGPACGVLSGLPVNGIYWDQVGEKLGEAVGHALDSACAGTFKFAFGKALTSSFNRRGREVIDRRVPVCAFFDEQNRLRGVIASASCHAVCNMDQNLSADYPSVLTRKAEYHYPDVPFLFLQGRGADVNPCMGGEAGIEKLGQELAESVFAALNQMKGNGLSRGPIDRQYRTVPVPMCIPPREKMEQELSSLVQQIRATEDVHERHTQSIEFVWRQKMLRILEKGKNPVVEADLALVIVGGEFALAFVSFELLTLTGNSIEEMLMQRGISADKCFVIGYTNQTNGYLAPSAESGMDGYETRGAAHWYGLPECCAESERTVLRTFSVMAEELFGE